MKSILQKEKECYVCRCKFDRESTYGLEEHHVFFGSSDRKQSEKCGLKVWLCQEHHKGNTGVHQDRQLDLELKGMAQAKFEETHTRAEFMALFWRNYL